MIRPLRALQGASNDQDEGEEFKNWDVVVPGQVVSVEKGNMRGHGTYVENEGSEILIASVAGFVDRVNKLISVKPLKSRYHAEVGDVVVGRIREVGEKRWKVDINARQDAVLQLSAINLPGGEQVYSLVSRIIFFHQVSFPCFSVFMLLNRFPLLQNFMSHPKSWFGVN